MKLIYSINIHTFVYQFERFPIDHYEGISSFTNGRRTKIGQGERIFGPALTKIPPPPIGLGEQIARKYFYGYVLLKGLRIENRGELNFGE